MLNHTKKGREYLTLGPLKHYKTIFKNKNVKIVCFDIMLKSKFNNVLILKHIFSFISGNKLKSINRGFSLAEGKRVQHRVFLTSTI